MHFYEYQQLAHKFANYDNDHYAIFGLAEESGEVCGKFAKIIRDKGGIISSQDRKEIAKELGDVLWMVSEIANNLGLSLDDVAINNINKLQDRQNRGVIHGNGDNR